MKGKTIILAVLAFVLIAISGVLSYKYWQLQNDVELQAKNTQLQMAFILEYGQGSIFTGADKVADARIVTRLSDGQTHVSFYIFDNRVGWKFIELGTISDNTTSP